MCGRDLSVILTHNVIWANQKTESFVHCLLHIGYSSYIAIVCKINVSDVLKLMFKMIIGATFR